MKHYTDLPFQVKFLAHTEQEKDRATTRMNVAAHQKEGNEKTGKRKQATDSEAACCHCAIVQGAARLKNGCVRRVPGVTVTLGKANSYFDPTQTGSKTALLR